MINYVNNFKNKFKTVNSRPAHPAKPSRDINNSYIKKINLWKCSSVKDTCKYLYDIGWP